MKKRPSKRKPRAAAKGKKPSKKGKSLKTKVSSLFSGIKVLKYTDPLEVYGCTPFSDPGGSCGTCFGSYTC